jgi:lysophospholipase L1-like esterase
MEMLLKNNKRFYFNSFYPSFIDEDNFDMSLLPPHFIDPDNCVSDVLKKYEVDNDVSVWEYESRKINDVNNEFHPNILGYKIIGEHLYHILNDKIVDI